MSNPGDSGQLQFGAGWGRGFVHMSQGLGGEVREWGLLMEGLQLPRSKGARNLKQLSGGG
jgi:hypothetical protein